MPLVITSLRGGHTDAHPHIYTHTHFADKINFKKPSVPVTGWREPGLKSLVNE